MNFDEARKRYLTDPAFMKVVDLLEHIISEMHLTPSEVREAAMLACIRFEQRRPLRGWIIPDPPADR